MRGARISPRLVVTPLTRPPRIAQDARDLAVLDDVDPERIGRARVAPGDRVVARGTAAALQRRAAHRVADVANVQRRAEGLGLLGCQPVVVDAGGAVGADVALEHLLVVHGVREHHDPARGEHDVVVEHLGEVAPQLHRVIVERGALLEEVVGADDGGVAAGVAAADPAFFEHRDLAQAVLGGQIVRRSQPVAAAADDERVVGALRLRSCATAAPSCAGRAVRRAAVTGRRRAAPWRSFRRVRASGRASSSRGGRQG